MRGTTIIEAVVALALGAGAGAGFIIGTGDLKGSAEITRLETEKASLEKQVADHRAETTHRQQLMADYEKAKARLEADQAAAAKAAEQAAAAKAAEEAKAKEAQARVEKLPAFGVLTVKALSGDLDIDAGPGLGGRGKSVDLAFEQQPGKIKLRSAKFTVTISPKPNGRSMGLDVTVSPLAIITADGSRLGTSAQNLVVDKKPFKLDFQSPAAGDLNLLLTYKK